MLPNTELWTEGFLNKLTHFIRRPLVWGNVFPAHKHVFFYLTRGQNRELCCKLAEALRLLYLSSPKRAEARISSPLLTTTTQLLSRSALMTYP